MKKLSYTVLILFIVLQSSNAQIIEPRMTLKNEFYSAYGFASLQEIGVGFAEGLASVLSFGTLQTNDHVAGPIIVGYKRNIDMNFTVGLMASYTGIESEWKKTNSNLLLSTNHEDFYTLMTRFDIVYVTNKWVQMYSGLSVGCTNWKSDISYTDTTKGHQFNEFHIAAHVNVFGLRVENKIGGFFELGFGYNGIINLGITYKF